MSDSLFNEAIEVLKTTLSIIRKMDSDILQKKDEVKKFEKLFHRKKTPRKSNGELYTYIDRKNDGIKCDQLKQDIAYLLRKRNEYFLKT
jgi:hypothetical protein